MYCSAANPADFCVPSVRSLWRSFTYALCHDCTELNKKNPILYFMLVLGLSPLILLFVHLRVYYINTS